MRKPLGSQLGCLWISWSREWCFYSVEAESSRSCEHQLSAMRTRRKGNTRRCSFLLQPPSRTHYWHCAGCQRRNTPASPADKEADGEPRGSKFIMRTRSAGHRNSLTCVQVTWSKSEHIIFITQRDASVLLIDCSISAGMSECRLCSSHNEGGRLHLCP